MTDILVREATTLPGVINLAGVGFFLYARPGRNVLDRLIVGVLTVISAFIKTPRPAFERNLEKLTERMVPAEQMSTSELAVIVVLFFGYNVACTLFVSAST
jgi:hypothetical protein